MHTKRIVAATVDFHKAQCYFSSTIQITALILYSQTIRAYAKAFGRKYYTDEQYDLTDIADLAALAFTALLPNGLTLLCIARYGRQSWYLITLSFITMVLGTATWAMSIQSVKTERDYLMRTAPYWEFQSYIDVDKCSIDGNYSSILFALCGSKYTERILSGARTFRHGQTYFASVAFYIAYVVSVFSILACVCMKLAPYFRSKRLFTRRIISIAKKRTTHTSLMILALILWPFCFASQFYYYYTYFQQGYVSKFWSFGQIIAVSVWIPSLVEFAYIQYSE